MDKIENELAEFINKYKHHVEYTNRSEGIKILENSLHYIRKLNNENESLNDEICEIKGDLSNLKKDFENYKKNNENSLQLAIEKFNFLSKVIYNNLDKIDHTKYLEIDAMINEIFSLLGGKIEEKEMHIII